MVTLWHQMLQQTLNGSDVRENRDPPAGAKEEAIQDNDSLDLRNGRQQRPERTWREPHTILGPFDTFWCFYD